MQHALAHAHGYAECGLYTCGLNDSINRTLSSVESREAAGQAEGKTVLWASSFRGSQHGQTP